MPIFIHPDLSGEGDIAAEGSGFIFFRRVFIQDTGSAHPIEGGSATRWLGLGWTALYETLPGGDGNGPAGQPFIDRRWCEFLYEGFDSEPTITTMNGASGTHYKFMPGVVATLTIYER